MRERKKKIFPEPRAQHRSIFICPSLVHSQAKTQCAFERPHTHTHTHNGWKENTAVHSSLPGRTLHNDRFSWQDSIQKHVLLLRSPLISDPSRKSRALAGFLLLTCGKWRYACRVVSCWMIQRGAHVWRSFGLNLEFLGFLWVSHSSEVQHVLPSFKGIVVQPPTPPHPTKMELISQDMLGVRS